MIEIANQMQSIMNTVGALVDADVLPDYEDETLHFCQDFDGDNDYTQNICLSKWEDDAVNIELRIWEEDDKPFATIQVYDHKQKEDEEPDLLPRLKDYLSNNPLFTFPDYSDDTDLRYYISQSIPSEYAKEIYVALVIAIQDYITTV